MHPIEGRQTRPYGEWASTWGADAIAFGSISLDHVRVDGDDVLWVEGRAADEGRYALVRRRPDGFTHDVTVPGANVRTRVHEYGGAPWACWHGRAWYSEFSDGRLYATTTSGGAPLAVSPDGPWRYADLDVDARRERLVCVREDRTADALARRGEPEDAIVAVSMAGDAVTVLVRGADFYAAPRVSPDGRMLAWLAWHHPNMPWDATELWVAEFDDDGTPTVARIVAGGPGESIKQPRWSPDGRLHFVSDRSGWWNLERLDDGDARVPVAPMEAEVGPPDWWLGQSSYAFLDDGTIAAVVRADGTDRLVRVTIPGSVVPVDVPYVEMGALQGDRDQVVLVAGSVDAGPAIVRIEPAAGSVQRLGPTPRADPDPSVVSVARPFEFPGPDGRRVRGRYYPPHNPAFQGPPAELPPLIVRVHGGPTLESWPSLSGSIQYFTSRGFAVLDVDYGGSTGYGRAYRRLLDGGWGVVDVEDCVAGALAAVRAGLADGARLAISGASSGGYTALAAMAFHDVFRAGTSHFGITDLLAWMRDTHKFESRYTLTIVGPYPERADLYRARSPAALPRGMSGPVLITQGTDDTIVPPSQAERMVAALAATGDRCVYLTFPGEGHDFRRATTIRRVLEAELSLYAQAFGIALADGIEHVELGSTVPR